MAGMPTTTRKNLEQKAREILNDLGAMPMAIDALDREARAHAKALRQAATNLLEWSTGADTSPMLELAWGLVKPEGDWRGEICCRLPENTFRDLGLGVDDIRAAIIWFTASEPEVRWDADDPRYLLVDAQGYRAGPAGP